MGYFLFLPFCTLDQSDIPVPKFDQWYHLVWFPICTGNIPNPKNLEKYFPFPSVSPNPAYYTALFWNPFPRSRTCLCYSEWSATIINPSFINALSAWAFCFDYNRPVQLGVNLSSYSTNNIIYWHWWTHASSIAMAPQLNLMRTYLNISIYLFSFTACTSESFHSKAEFPRACF